MTLFNCKIYNEKQGEPPSQKEEGVYRYFPSFFFSS